MHARQEAHLLLICTTITKSNTTSSGVSIGTSFPKSYNWTAVAQSPRPCHALPLRGPRRAGLWPPWAAAQLYPVGESFSCPDGFTRSAVSPGGLRFEELEAEEQARLVAQQRN